MDSLLLVYILSFCLLPVKSDILIQGPQNSQPVNDIEIYSIDISSLVTSRFAHNVITSKAVNHANESKEAIFDVDLPKTAFITNFTMTIDGESYPGVIKEKEVARKQYETAVSRGQSAGIVRASSGRKTEKFTVSVNVAAQSNVTFELVYEELLKRQLGKYEMFIKVQPKTLVKHFQIEVDIYEPQGISFLDAEASFITNDLLPTIQKTFSGKKGNVSFKPLLDQQRSCANCDTTVLDGDFTVTYDVNRETPGNIQIVNGYFVHFFAPKLDFVPKSVIYVIDRSSSMMGQKIEQTRQALLKILDDTAEHDYFNFVLFDSGIEVWSDKLVKATPENLSAARQYVSNIHPQGATNINSPLLKAVELLNKAHNLKEVPERSVSLIVLLTDGQANTGETIQWKIQENVKLAIQGKYTLYSLGFGYGVDYPFLEKLALENSGIARRIYEDSDVVLQLQGFYNEIANPTLLDIKMKYSENATSNVTQNNFKQYFDGSEIVVAGQITDNNLNFFTAYVKAEGANKSLKYSENVQLQKVDGASKEQEYIFGDFIERLWAYLTIQQLLEKRVYAEPQEKESLTAQALDLSLKFKFVTPLTSMVVTKPEDKEEEEQTIVADKFVDGQSAHFALPVPVRSNAAAPVIPAQHIPSYFPRNWVDSDPHFVISVPRKNDALCFNIQEQPGVILNLIEDRELGIAVNGELVGDKTTGNNLISNETYFGRLGVVNKAMNLLIEVTTETIIILRGNKRTTFSWLDKASINSDGLNLAIDEGKQLKFSFGEGATFVIILHKVWKDHPLHRDFLGFYTLDDDKFSKGVHGLLGQFFYGIDYEISNIHATADPNKPDATMKVKDKLITVTRGTQRDYMDGNTDDKVSCWFVHFNGEGLIDGSHTDYIVEDIFKIA
ncbi:inter-alpha-trypsin inhibitor heavy chain H3-like [Phyllobates terribilis]|uniref:inter-alpha-trypsin inhibitor heavy chain H3-like n=1 Tax=Phyllobates terribilis TaxID=111132 RepID=UPI003CCA9913